MKTFIPMFKYMGVKGWRPLAYIDFKPMTFTDIEDAQKVINEIAGCNPEYYQIPPILMVIFKVTEKQLDRIIKAQKLGSPPPTRCL